jgi:hypothetical protein
MFCESAGLLAYLLRGEQLLTDYAVGHERSKTFERWVLDKRADYVQRFARGWPHLLFRNPRSG